MTIHIMNTPYTTQGVEVKFAAILTPQLLNKADVTYLLDVVDAQAKANPDVPVTFTINNFQVTASANNWNAFASELRTVATEGGWPLV